MSTQTSDSSSRVVLNNGIVGTPIAVASGNPATFFEAVSAPESVPAQEIQGHLFLPQERTGPHPVVIMVPGSLGVAESHLTHCATLTDLGIAAFAIDPFGARQVTSTVANQAQYSFAASSWDVIAATQTMAATSDIDAARIGAQGHSRGGSAVLNAIVEPMAKTHAAQLAAVYAAYPWCGFQFMRPEVGTTRVRSIIGDRDEWCSAQQVQGAMHAMALAGGEASCRVVPGAWHSFDRGTARTWIEEASVAPGAPTVFLTAEGRMVHAVEGVMPEETREREMMLYGIKAGYGRRGAHIGTEADEHRLFRDDMVDFWTRALQP